MLENFKNGFDIFSQVAFLILGSMVFWQIRIAKKDLQIRSKRESGAVSTELANRFATEIIPEISEIHLKAKSKNHELKSLPLKNFYAEEYGRLKHQDKQVYDEGINFFKANADLSKDCTMILNSFEAFAMNFIKRIADEEVVFTALAQVYCNFVEKSFPILCATREEKKLNLYENTVALYKIWSKKIDKEKEKLSKGTNINEQGTNINEQLALLIPMGYE